MSNKDHSEASGFWTEEYLLTNFGNTPNMLLGVLEYELEALTQTLTGTGNRSIYDSEAYAHNVRLIARILAKKASNS